MRTLRWGAAQRSIVDKQDQLNAQLNETSENKQQIDKAISVLKQQQSSLKDAQAKHNEQQENIA